MTWKAVKLDTALMVAAYGLFLVWAIIHTVYEDHQGLTNQINQLKNVSPDLEIRVDVAADGQHKTLHKYMVYW